MRILHAVHDFLPHHCAGAEIYAFNLARELSQHHFVTVLAGAYDPTRPHAQIVVRRHRGLEVVELVNNWNFARFRETYEALPIHDRLAAVLAELQPEVLHIHSLTNLCLSLPRLAVQRGIRVVASLHDYALLCPAGGQRLEQPGQRLCRSFQPARCAACFSRSAHASKMTAGRLLGRRRVPGPLWRLAQATAKGLPGIAPALASRVVARPKVPASDIARRARQVAEAVEAIEILVAPSKTVAHEHWLWGVPAEKIEISSHGFPHIPALPRQQADGRTRIGFVGTLVWHKGAHVLLEAARALAPGPFEVLVFGDPGTSPSYSARLKRYARGLPVRFMGSFDPEHVAEVYSKLDVLAVPSLWPENAPLVVREAFLAGVAVVASRIGGLAEIIEHEHSGLLCKPGSARALAEALTSLVGAPERRAALAARVPPVKSMAADATEWELRYRGRA